MTTLHDPVRTDDRGQVAEDDLLGPLPTPRPRRRLGPRWHPLALTAPALLFLLAFTVLPAIGVFVLSFTNWNFLFGTTDWVGLENFRRVLPSQELSRAVQNTFIYTALTVPTSVVLGLLVALGIHSLTRGKGWWRALYFLPVVSTLVASSVAWRWLFFPRTGLVDSTIGELTGWTGWLNSLDLALPATAVVGVWAMVGYNAVLFLAGLAGVPAHLHEAAKLDGASAWSRFWHVTWPALGPATLFVLVINLTFSLQAFETIIVLTQGGPLGHTETLLFVLWRRGIDFLDIGGGSVVALVLLMIVLAATFVQMRTFGRRLEEAGSR